MERTCATQSCDVVIPPQLGRARPRKFCEVCRPPRGKPNPRVIQLPEPEGRLGAAAERSDEDEPRLVASYRKQLEDAELLDTPDGAHVMHLATLFATGSHTASGAASLSRELRAAMEVAVKDAPRAPDKLDELAARRIQKVNGA